MVLKNFNLKGEEGLISNTGISKTEISKVSLSRKLGRQVARKNATVSSNLISKTAVLKLQLEAKLY